jgi:hypothetical protein
MGCPGSYAYLLASAEQGLSSPLASVVRLSCLRPGTEAGTVLRDRAVQEGKQGVRNRGGYWLSQALGVTATCPTTCQRARLDWGASPWASAATSRMRSARELMRSFWKTLRRW